MAIINVHIVKPIYVCTFKRQIPKICVALGTTAAAAANANAIQYSSHTTKPCNQIVIRRSGNYKPPIWEFDYIQSLKIEHAGEIYVTRASELKMQVKMMLHEAVEPLDQLELIDNLQRLGISYHFENEIKQILSVINRKYSKNDQDAKINDLYATALEFRLLRQHGFNVSQEIFDRFKNEKGEFKPSLCDDTKGLLQLYEASFLSMEGESTLEIATEFTIKHLDDQTSIDKFHSPLVHHGLELPLHWTIQRAEARWFINMYGDRLDMNPILLELAKLDFNIVQAKYQQELKHVSRWDVSSIHQLPEYMQICYLALNNFVNEMAYDVLKEKGLIIIPYLRKAWADLCKAYLQEAKWYFNGYKPTMEEYMNNAWISISTPVILSHAFFAVTNPIEKEAPQYLLNYPDLICWSATILRLSDDLATSSVRI
ncbi:(-)-alpha-terpineol synthase [Forsythia ovata]|uniref:(-)-alpha-terpineol synthase n=1 Tax=Forsythia ovata TaxID=205694 RepID=A0ABD1QKV7_9LAMI